MLVEVQNVHNALLAPGLKQTFNYIRPEQLLMSLNHLQSQKSSRPHTVTETIREAACEGRFSNERNQKNKSRQILRIQTFQRKVCNLFLKR